MLLDYRLSRGEILERLGRESDETIQAVVIDMENWLDGVESSTLLLARVLAQREYSHTGLEQMLRDAVEVNDDVFGASIALAPASTERPAGFAPYYFRRDGQLIYADLADQDYSYQQQSWYIDAVAAGRPLWVEPYYDAGGGGVLMTTFAAPVYRQSAAGERFLYAVVTADVSLEELHHYLQRLRLGTSGFGILLSRNGIVLSGRDPANIMSHYSGALTSETDRAVWQGMFNAALQGEVVSRSYTCPDIPGRCIIRMGALETTGWPVGVVYSEDELTAPLRAFGIKTAVAGFFTLLLMAAAVTIVTRRLTRPLTELARASDRMAQGDLDVELPTPRGDDEVARLIHSFGAMNRDLKTYIADLEEATARRSRLEGELGAARDIQMAMLQHAGEASEHEQAYSLWAHVLPARSVGGDLYLYQRRERSVFIAVGDVSDKGVPAALFMARAISLIQQLATVTTCPATAMASLNNALTTGNDNCMFVTLFLGILDLDSLALQFSSAGHTAPSLVSDEQVTCIPQDSGPALGLAHDLTFPINSLQLEAGDRLAIFTDGFDEAFNEADQMFGISRFNAALLASRALPTATAGAGLFDTLATFAGDTAQSDDITLLLLDIAGGDHRTVNKTRVFANGSELTGQAISWLRETLGELRLPSDIAGELILVLEEIASNIYKHAGLPDGAAVTAVLDAEAGQLLLEVSDGGTEFNPLQQAQRAELGAEIDEAAIGGLGVHLITALTDAQSYRRANGCNILRVTKLLPGPPD